MKTINITRSPYFNKKLKGNECQKFIKDKNYEILKEILIDYDIPKSVVTKFVTAFESIRSEIKSAWENQNKESYLQSKNSSLN